MPCRSWTVTHGKSKRDDGGWYGYGRIFDDGLRIIIPSFCLSVGIERTVGDVDNGAGSLVVEVEYYIGAFLRVVGRRYG